MILALSLFACAGGSDTRVAIGNNGDGKSAAPELDRSSFVRLPVPQLVGAEVPPFAAVTGGQALLVAPARDTTEPRIGSVGVLHPDKTIQATDPLPPFVTAEPVGLVDGFAIAGTTCKEQIGDECLRLRTLVVFLDFDGKVTDAQVVSEDGDANAEPVAFGRDVVVVADGYHLVRPQGSEPLEVPGKRSTVCALWPGALLALELVADDAAKPEDGPFTLQAYEFEDGTWSAIEGSRRIVGDRVWPRCIPGGVQYGPSFWTPSTGWFSLKDEALYPSPELAPVATATGTVVLVSPPGPRQVDSNGATHPLLSPGGDKPVTAPTTATSFTVALDQEGKAGLLVSAPAPSTDLAAQFLDVG